MKLKAKIAILTGALALIPATPSAAVDYHPGKPDYKPAPTTTPPPPPHAKAHGKRCQGKSKKHVKGQKGTEFSRCVRALRKAANNPNMAPGQVCKHESKEHVKGQRGTAFSRCVKRVVRQRRAERKASHEAAKVSKAAPATA